MNDFKTLELIFKTKLSKYKEDYEQEIILHIVAMCFVLFLILHGWKNTDLDRLFAFIFGLISVFIFYEKFYQYIIIDAIGLDKDHIHMMTNEAYIYSAKLDNLGIKINSDRNGGLSRTFYDISTNKRLFNFRDKDIGEEESEILMEKLALHIGCEKNVFSELTYNQVVPMSLNNISDKAMQSKVQHIINQYEYKKYVWLIIPVVAVAVTVTHYVLNY